MTNNKRRTKTNAQLKFAHKKREQHKNTIINKLKKEYIKRQMEAVKVVDTEPVSV